MKPPDETFQQAVDRICGRFIARTMNDLQLIIRDLPDDAGKAVKRAARIAFEDIKDEYFERLEKRVVSQQDAMKAAEIQRAKFAEDYKLDKERER